MMNNNSPASDQYHKFYASLRFEREGLFELIRDTYHLTEVLYPGCALHLTPAFYFPHVVFLDQDPDVQAFFARRSDILELVRRRRTYRRSPYIQFIFQDFNQPLPLPESQFDLLLGLFVRGAAKACLPYLKPGGFYLSNNHKGDAQDAFQDSRLSLVAVLQQRHGKYRLVAYDPLNPFVSSQPACKAKRYLRETSAGVEYVEHETYYMFRQLITYQRGK